MIFEQFGVAGLVDVHEFDWSLLQLERDVYSLELPEFAQSVLVSHRVSKTRSLEINNL